MVTIRVFVPALVLVAIICFGFPGHAQITENLVAHYAFDEGTGTTAADSSGNNLHGTLTGTAWTDGRINGALSFDGQLERVDIGTVDISGSELTIMAWIRIRAFSGPSSDGRIISKADSTAEGGHYWMLSTINSGGTKLRFRLKTNGTTSTLIGGNVAVNEWIHVAAVYDGSQMKIYKDGQEVVSAAKTGTLSENSSVEAWIGDQPPTPGTRPWDGIIDEVRIYEKALNGDEIRVTMNNGNEFPIVSLTAPEDNQRFSPGEAVPLAATASDPDGSIQSVEFYSGQTKIGEDLASPYTAIWPDVPEGTYSITARAFDNEGSFSDSHPPHQIIVGGGGPTEDWVHMSSADGDLPLPTTNGNQQTASLVLDVNKDGITDFVITDRSVAPSVVWYESSSTAAWTRHVVEPDRLPIEAGGTFTDIDNDGDLDLVFGGDNGSNMMWWWENPHPEYQGRWSRRMIKNSGSNKYHDQMFGDYDGDGQDELASWNQGAGQLILFEIPADPKNTEPWSYTNIASASSSHEGMAAFDVDGDEVSDIVGAGRWYRHAGGGTYDEYLVDSDQTYGRASAAQFIPGGYAELVYGPGDSSGDLKFYTYDGIGGWDSKLLKAGVDHGHSLHVADFDGDGNTDIFCAEMRLSGGNPDAKMWIFHGDGAGNFTESIVAEGFGNHESRPADLDGDGDVDILGKPYNWEAPRVDIWLNRGTGESLSLDNWERHLIDGAMPDNGVFIQAGDMNGDADLDLIAGAWWWENPGTLDGAWTRHTIGNSLNNAAVVHDFDGDTDLDILGTTGMGSSSSRTFRWARNNGSGLFSILDNIQTGGSGDFLQGSLVSDFGVGDQVVLSWHNGGGGVQVLGIPDDPESGSWPFSTLSTTTLKEDLSAGDIDRDGDIDLLLGTVWLENDSGSWTSHTLGEVNDLHSGAEPDRNDLADINRDGRLDAVIGLENGTSIVWFEAPVDPTQPWRRSVIGSVAGQGFSMDTADFDGDSDPDVVVGEHRGGNENRVIIFENQDSGAAWVEHVIDSDAASTIDHHDGTQAIDLDNDGDLDLISLGWYNRKVWIYENKAIDGPGPGSAPMITTQPGDESIYQGQTLILSVAAVGSGTVEYQWRRNGIDIPFATESSLETGPLSLGDSGDFYSCSVRNSFGEAVSRDAVVTVEPLAGTNDWWNTDWSYRIPITVDAGDNERRDIPVVLTVNFTEVLAALGIGQAFDPNSIRVIESSISGAVVNEQVAFQFDPDTNYDPVTFAAGELVILVNGTTTSDETRYYHVYFDIAGSEHSALEIPVHITATDEVWHKGFESVQIDTRNASWYFHKEGAGFATLLDSEDQDWIGFINASGSDASGWYRGIPNAVYPEDMMHPGRSGCTSTITHQGAIRVIISSICGEWQSVWKVYPLYAEMTMTAHGHEYWFQYEGTPGGSTEDTDFVVTADGTVSQATSGWTQDIDGEEWVYLGDAVQDRVFFMVPHEQDSHPERFYRMNGGGGDGMVIFAFGRGNGTTRFLDSTPLRFSVGLLETKEHSLVTKEISGLYENLSVTQGSVEASGAVSPISPANLRIGN